MERIDAPRARDTATEVPIQPEVQFMDEQSIQCGKQIFVTYQGENQWFIAEDEVVYEFPNGLTIDDSAHNSVELNITSFDVTTFFVQPLDGGSVTPESITAQPGAAVMFTLSRDAALGDLTQFSLSTDKGDPTFKIKWGKGPAIA